MAKDLRLIYEAATEEEGASALDGFSERWDRRYPHVSASPILTKNKNKLTYAEIRMLTPISQKLKKRCGIFIY